MIRTPIQDIYSNDDESDHKMIIISIGASLKPNYEDAVDQIISELKLRFKDDGHLFARPNSNEFKKITLPLLLHYSAKYKVIFYVDTRAVKAFDYNKMEVGGVNYKFIESLKSYVNLNTQNVTCVNAYGIDLSEYEFTEDGPKFLSGYEIWKIIEPYVLSMKKDLGIIV